MDNILYSMAGYVTLSAENPTLVDSPYSALALAPSDILKSRVNKLRVVS